MARLVSIFSSLTYRSALTKIVKDRKSLGRGFTLRALAESADLQPSFLTNVLKGRFDFSADQLFAISTALGLAEDERDYLLLLLEHERSVYRPRHEKLRKEIDRIRKDKLLSEKRLAVMAVEQSMDEQAQYYLDPFAILTLVHLSIAPYDREPSLLANALGMSEAHLAQTLDLLARIGHAKRDGRAFRPVHRDAHLPTRNPLFRPNMALMRMRSIDQLQRLPLEASYTHSVTITGTEETKRQLSEAYLKFLKVAREIVRPAKSERAYQMNFDLFPWTLR